VPIFLVQVWLFHGFIVDDAFITFRYVRQWTHGNGLVYNIGEPAEGYSNFLWIVLLAPFDRLGIDLVLVAKGMGKETIFASQRAGEHVLLYVCPACTAQKWIERFETQPPAAYVLTTKEDGRYTQVTRDPQVLARCYEDRVAIGSYLIYVRKTLACAP